jgi:hypothetical protein
MKKTFVVVVHIKDEVYAAPQRVEFKAKTRREAQKVLNQRKKWYGFIDGYIKDAR